MTNGVGHFPKEITTKPCRPARCPFVGSVSFSFFHFYSCPIGFDFHLYHCSSVNILFCFLPYIYSSLFIFIFSLSVSIAAQNDPSLRITLVFGCFLPCAASRCNCSDDEDDDDLEFIDAYPKRASLPIVSPLPLRSKAVQRQLSVD